MCCCCREPLAGFYRDGYCRTGLGDGGLTHYLRPNVRRVAQFLGLARQRPHHTAFQLSRPEGGRPVVRLRDCWKEALDAGVAAPLDLERCTRTQLSSLALKSCRRMRWIGFVKKRSVLCLRTSICLGRSPRLSTRGSKATRT